MVRTNTAGVAGGEPAAKSSGQADSSHHSNNRANAPAGTVVAIRPNLRHCPFCGFWLLRGTVMEALHSNNCPKMEQHRREEARREAIRLEAEAWRRADRERLRKSRGVPIRRSSAPLPERQPHRATRARLSDLQDALRWPELHGRLSAATGLPLEALERVAAGRSTMAAAAWRRLLAELGR